jgi:MFS transporter, DHA1 family, tetracycline resistance protein
MIVSTVRALGVPCLLLLVAMFNLTLVVAGLEELILDDLGGTTRQASWFFSIEMLAYVVFAPLWGLVADRTGRRRAMVVVGFAASAALYAVFALLRDVEVLLLVRFGQGALSVMAWSTLMSLPLDHPDQTRRGRAMGWMGASLIFGVSLGAPVGGILSSHLGVRAPLWTASVLFAFAAALALAVGDPARGSTRAWPGWRAISARLAARPRLLVPYLFHFVDRYTVGFLVVLFPLYLGSLGVEDPALKGRYLAAFLLPFALLQAVTGRIVDRIGSYPPLILGSLAYGAVLCTVGVSGLYSLWWVMLGLGVLASVMFPPAIALTAEMSDPQTRGVTMGGFNVAGSLGFAVGPVVGAEAFAAGGFGFAFVVGGVLELGLATAVGLWLLSGAWSRRAARRDAAAGE